MDLMESGEKLTLVQDNSEMMFKEKLFQLIYITHIQNLKQTKTKNQVLKHTRYNDSMKSWRSQKLKNLSLDLASYLVERFT